MTSADWNGKTAIVTGAASGIGRALVAALAGRGTYVVATDLSAPAEGDERLVLDVRDAAAFRTIVEDVARRRPMLDFLFNNAGVGIGGEVEELTDAHWKFVMDVNVGGVIHGILAAYPVMLRQSSGHIVNVASLAGLGAAPLLVPYAASKAAVVGISRGLRLEAADRGVRVSVLCPGAIDTPLLDRANPPDLPPIRWRPDIRRFLTRVGGAPYPADAFAEEALDAIAKNEGVIVIPSRARLRWRIGRLAPGLAEKRVLRELRAARRGRRPIRTRSSRLQRSSGAADSAGEKSAAAVGGATLKRLHRTWNPGDPIRNATSRFASGFAS